MQIVKIKDTPQMSKLVQTFDLAVTIKMKTFASEAECGLTLSL